MKMKLKKNKIFCVIKNYFDKSAHPVQWRSHPDGPPNWRRPFAKTMFKFQLMFWSTKNAFYAFSELEKPMTLEFTWLKSWRSLYTVSSVEEGQSPLNQNWDTVSWTKIFLILWIFSRAIWVPDKLLSVFDDSQGHRRFSSGWGAKNQNSSQLNVSLKITF